MHSNATVGCPGRYGGTQTFNYYGNASGSFLAGQILDHLKHLSPGTRDFRQPRTDWDELRLTTSTAVYVESAFHDWPADEKLRQYGQWAWRIPWAVDVRLGYP